MAVVSMKRISIYGLKRDRKAILEMLQRAGAVEVAAVKMGKLQMKKEKKNSLEKWTFLLPRLSFKKECGI